MTIQQLEYMIAMDTHKHFVRAAKQCGVTQPTLSMMIQKLEEELDTTIFDRSKKPIEPTTMGLKIIEQARKSLKEIGKVKEIVVSETQTLAGKLSIGIIPTLASYLVPTFVKSFIRNYPSLQLYMSEMTTAEAVKALKQDDIDMIIAATPLEDTDFYEIPLFYEKFVAYFASGHSGINTDFSIDNLPAEDLWVLKEGHCFREQVFNFCQNTVPHNCTFEAGSIETLIKIVDTNGGYTFIPELHLDLLSDGQKKNIRRIDSPPAVREISIVINKTFVKEKIINGVADTVKSIIPDSMLNERLKKFSIKL